MKPDQRAQLRRDDGPSATRSWPTKTPPTPSPFFKQNGDKLFHVHMNDNYRLWDDDMMVRFVHFIEYLEFFLCG